MEDDENQFLNGKQTQIKNYGWGWRHVITALGSFSTFTNYVLRVNLSMAIVVMVNQTALLAHQDQQTSTISGAFDVNSNESNVLPLDVCWQDKAGDLGNEQQEPTENEDGSFLWSTEEQGVILASFFYGYTVLTIPGGVLATRFGGKWINGGGMFIAGLITFFTPLAASWSVPVLVALRVVLGISLSATFPAIQCIVSHWIPPCERSKLPVLIFSGASSGTVVCFAVSGFLISSLGWESVFYVSGALCFIWLTLWAVFVTNSPKEHKWISDAEREFIVQSIAQIEHRKHSKTIGLCDIPWQSALTSFPVWAVFASHFCMHAGMVVYVTMLPLYFRTIHGMDIRKNGLLAALPFVAFFVVANTGSHIADILRSREIMSTTHVRKLFNCCALFSAGASLLMVCFVGCNTTAVVMLLLSGHGLAGLAMAGFQVNTLDIAPQFAGVLMACSLTIANISGFVVPSIVGEITKNNETLSAWRHVFYIFVCSYWFGALFYFFCGSGVVQSWAKDKIEESDHDCGGNCMEDPEI